MSLRGYQPRAASVSTEDFTVVRVFPSQMRAAVNTPDGATVLNKRQVWRFDSSANEAVSFGVDVPKHWTTFDVILEWTNLSSGSGDVVWRADVTSTADGGSLSTPSGGTSATVTAPAQDVLETSTVESGVSRSDNHTVCVVTRIASDVADTLGNDAGLVAVKLSKVS